MNKISLLISIVLIIILLFLIKYCKNYNNIEGFRYDNPTQNQTGELIQPIRKMVDDNSKIIQGSGDLLMNKKNNILNNVTNTNKILKENQENITRLIVEADVLKNFQTQLNETTKERTILPEYVGKKCKDTNLDLPGSAQGDGALKICAHHCTLNNDCISFNYDRVNNKCNLSSLCSLNNTEDNNDFDLYFKNNVDTNSPLTNYDLHSNKQCSNDNEKSEFIEHTSNTLKECAENCSDDPGCISFDYNTTTDKCRLTKRCYKENSTNNNKFNLYQKKDISVHPYTRTITIPCQKKHRIVYHKFYNNFCLDSQGNKAKLKKCKNKGDSDTQTFIHNSFGYLENNNGKCLYYEPGTSGPQHGKEIKLQTCPTEFKKNYKWNIIENTKGGIKTQAIVSDMKNTNTNKEYALNAQNGMQYFSFNDLNNDIKSNNNSQLTLSEYNSTAKSHSDTWFRDYY
jgi:hypothetical protein